MVVVVFNNLKKKNLKISFQVFGFYEGEEKKNDLLMVKAFFQHYALLNYGFSHNICVGFIS